MVRSIKIPKEIEAKMLNLILSNNDRKVMLAILGKLFKIKNNTLGRWLEHLEAKKYILKIGNQTPNIYQITYVGKQHLATITDSIKAQDPLNGIENDLFFSLDKFSMKYPIVENVEIWKPTEIQMNGWIKSFEFWGNVTICYNGDKSIEVWPQPLIGPDKAELFIKAQAVCDGVVKLLQNQYGFVLQPGEINRSFTLEVTNNDIKQIHKEVGFIRGKIDSSGLGGELNFTGKDPIEVSNKVQGLIDMPGQLPLLKQELMYLNAKVDLMADAMAQMLKIMRGASEIVSQQPQPPTDPLDPSIKAEEKPNQGVEIA